MKNKFIKRVVVALSGGMDSAVAAGLLKQRGMSVISVFFILGTFSSVQKERAKKIAKILGIDFLRLDLRKQFKKEVVEPFLKELQKGNTPNPCVICNPQIKFEKLIRLAKRLNADHIATGHYAKVQKRNDGIHLYKGKDKEKDQSYFLWQLNQNQLLPIIFPLEELTKAEVKKIAKKLKLPAPDAPESQEICFINDGLNQFLKKHLKLKPGHIVDKKGQILGKHEGLPLYTIGQRKGIKLPQGPYFVLEKDTKKNLLIVTKDERDLYEKELLAKKWNWILGKEPNMPLKIRAKIRYRHQAASAKIMEHEAWNMKHGTYRIVFDRPQRAITPGQSVVFYEGNKLLGGGIIC